jgi:hypothetical protein
MFQRWLKHEWARARLCKTNKISRFAPPSQRKMNDAGILFPHDPLALKKHVRYGGTERSRKEMAPFLPV